MAPQHCETPASPQQAQKAYEAVVVCIGDEPELNVRGVGNVRFAYRHVKKAPGAPKPVVRLGDRVTCRLAGSPLKALSVRIQASPKHLTPPFLFKSASRPSSTASFGSLPMTKSFASSSRASLSSPIPQEDDGTSQNSADGELRAVSFCHDPYSMSAVKLEYAPATPNASMRSMGNTSGFFMSPASSPRHGR